VRDVPLSAPAKAAIGRGAEIEDLLSGGDDYELAIAAPSTARTLLVALAADAKVPLTRIGRVVKGRGVAALDADGRPVRFEHAGYTHF
jgi:thiamine-monophosphate kinase